MKYILMERDFEYNDEGYTANDGGTPKRIFNTEAEAESVVNDVLLEMFRAGKAYMLEGNEFDSELTKSEQEELTKRYPCLVLDEWYVEEILPWPKMTMDEMLGLVEELTILGCWRDPYYVIGVAE